MGSDTDEAYAALALVLCLKNKKKEKRKWMNDMYKVREPYTREKLLREIKLSKLSELMDFATFDILLKKLSPTITKQNTIMRDAIPASQRLVIALKYLTTGSTYKNLQIASGISETCIGVIVMETCNAIIKTFRHYITTPKTQNEWISVADKFNNKCNFPNCLGSVNGMHVAIRKPIGSSVMYYNHSKFYSIVLMAVVNANYEFMMVDTGNNEKMPGIKILYHRKFAKELSSKLTNIPEKRLLLNSDRKLPFVFVGNEAFELTDNFLIPFDESEVTTKEQIFNNRLSNVQRIAENTLGFLVSKFGILQTPIFLSPNRVATVVLACCYLHNFLLNNPNQIYMSPGSIDTKYMMNDSFLEGLNGEYTGLEVTQCENVSMSAKTIRDNYCDLFNNENQLPCQ